MKRFVCWLLGHRFPVEFTKSGHARCPRCGHVGEA